MEQSLWSETDESFFRIVHPLFTHDFVLGAGVLLMSYDDEQARPVTGVVQPVAGAVPAVVLRV